MRGKASIESHEATALQDMLQRDHNIICKLKDYTNKLGQIKVLGERLCSMDLQISELQMRPLTHILEGQLVRLEDGCKIDMRR